MAGFYISPAERLRAMRVIGQFGQDNLQSPERLKLLLCPIIAQGKAEQAKFYDLFDQYWAQVMQPWEMPVLETPPNFLQKNAGWLRWLLVALVLGGLGYAVYKLSQVSDPSPLKASFRHPDKVRMGQNLRFENLSENHDSLCTFQWDIFDDLENSEEPEFTTTDSFDLTYPISSMGKSPFKRVKLTSIHPFKKDTAVFEGKFTILCSDMPKIDSVVAAAEAGIGEPIDFKVFTKEKDGLKVEWGMGDTPYGQEVVLENKTVFQHSYQDDGLYQIRLNVSREGAEGYCQVDTFFQIKIGGEKAYLAAKTLQKDTISAIVNFSYGLWILMGLIGLPIIWFWVKWAARPTPQPASEADDLDLEAAAMRFKSSDKAPYKIPFRSHNGAVQVDKDLYRLADVMRQRQEGLRKEMDVPTSVEKTISEGGFPQLLTKADVVPTEFLFLIDGQVEGSHQRHLCQWIVGFLQQREVLGEVFFYNEGLQRFWNNQFPDGISHSQLQRMYGFHKLIVLGDGHSFIDPTPNFERQRPKLRPAASELFGHWKQRFLLTPTPVVSWTYREGVLHDRFAIFPMDTAGLNMFIKYLEHGVEDEERPPYKMWSEKHLEKREETDINYRNWRSAADYQDYLNNHPNLYKWLCAIALYPKPEWDMTLAIGRALSSQGVDVTFDNLLVLSRIPWLINGDLSPNLRHQLVDSLDGETEHLARKAIETELQSVADSVKDGHANLEHQTNLALQQFALDPKDAGAQKSIQQLMALGLLTPRHFVEINQSISRQSAVGSSQSAVGKEPAKMDRNADALKSFLEENKKRPEPLKKPFFTKDFWWATALSLLFIALFLIGWNYGASDELAKWAGIDINDSTECKDEYSHFYFLKKECIADSAVLYNNQAVGIWENMAGDATEKTPVIMREVNQLNLDLADSLFAQAIAMRPNYDIAISNKEKLNYNIGVQEYHAYLSDSSDVDGLQKAMEYFDKIKLDSFKLDAMHGKGLAEFYIARSLYQQPNISQSIYSQIMAQDSFYFSTINTYPHLQSLLAIRKNVTLNIIDADTKRPITDVIIIDKKNNRFKTNASGMTEIKMVQGERRIFEFNKNGYEKLNREIIDSVGRYSYKIELKKAVAAAEPGFVSNTANIYFDIALYQIREDAKMALDSIFLLMKQNPSWLLEITPYFADDRTSAYNKTLSISRADAVVKYLTGKGVGSERLMILASSGIQNGITNISEEEKRRVALNFNKEKDTEAIADDDGDGVPNQDDKCPNEKGTKENNGCKPNFPTVKLNGQTWLKENLGVNTGEGSYCFNDNGEDCRKYGRLYTWEAAVNACHSLGNGWRLPTDREWNLVVQGFGGYYDFPKKENVGRPEDALKALSSEGTSGFDGLYSGWRTANGKYVGQGDNGYFWSSTRVAGDESQAWYYSLTKGHNRVYRDDGNIMDAYSCRCVLDDGRGPDSGSTEQNAQTAAPPDLGRLLKELEANMVFVEGGTFQMGCDPKRDGECRDDELPLHDVTLSSYYIGKYEVTQELWEAVMGENPSRFSDCSKCPVEQVSWNDIQDFLKKLNEKSGQKFRLPTEAEWEFAARGGSRSKGYEYSGGNDIDKEAWHDNNSGKKTHPVGQKQPNELGLYDMSGNVYEWCSDWYGGNYYEQFLKEVARNPIGPNAGEYRVCRGGSWFNNPLSCRAAFRGWFAPAGRGYNIGFRVAQE